MVNRLEKLFYIIFYLISSYSVNQHQIILCKVISNKIKVIKQIFYDSLAKQIRIKWPPYGVDIGDSQSLPAALLNSSQEPSIKGLLALIAALCDFNDAKSHVTWCQKQNLHSELILSEKLGEAFLTF